jgi:shikimate kinase
LGDRIVLVGMMGAGKTTVGQRLASRLGWRYIDSDQQVMASTGRSVREIFESDGEPAFRRLESDALRDAMNEAGDAVVGVAGGAVLDAANRALLRTAGVVVWLRARVDVLAARASGGDHRPLLGDDALGAITRLYSERERLYEDLADVVIDVDETSPDDVVAAVLRHVGAAG